MAKSEMNKVKFEMIEAYSKQELEEAVNDFLADNIKLVDWLAELWSVTTRVLTQTYNN